MSLSFVGLSFVGSKKDDSVKNAIIQILAEEWPLTVKEIFKRSKQDFGKDISYQAVHKTVQELVSKRLLVAKNKAYSINTFWLQEMETFANLTLDKYSEEEHPRVSKPKSQLCKLRVYDSSDMFYELMVPLLRKEKEFRFSSKTPSLIISMEEKLTPARQKYVEELRKAIEERNTKVKYLISGDATKELVLKSKDRQSIEKLKKFSNIKNTKIKCAPIKAIMSYAVTKRDLFINPTSITHFAPVAVIHFKGGDMSMIQRVFDIIFAEADETKGLIEELEKELSRKSKEKK